MDTKHRQVRERIRQLERQAEQLRREELRQVIAELRAKVREYSITADQLFGLELSALVRYRDPDSGRTWTGLGRPPNWIRGQDRERYRVGPDDTPCVCAPAQAAIDGSWKPGVERIK